VQAYADKIIFVCNGKEIGRHERKFTKGQTYYNYQHYLPILARKPGALRNGEPFANMDLPDELNRVRQILERSENGPRDFAHILSHIPVESIESVINACATALNMNAVSKDVILNILFRKNDEPDISDIKEDDPEYLKLKYIPEENCRSYDQLLSGLSIKNSIIREVSL